MHRYVIKSADDRKFQIVEEALRWSDVWKPQVADKKPINPDSVNRIDSPEETEIELSGCSKIEGSTLELLAEWCNHYVGLQRPPTIPEGDWSGFRFSEWDKQFFKTMSPVQLKTLTMTAKRLGMPLLFASCIRSIYVVHVEGQTVEKVRAFFGEIDDFTYEEKEYARYERTWLSSV
ncbi:hypothetical protein L596_024261 [Steinernema carpocapsae]|uniref:SKP1 component dimerisation domain-containing protein n=1 Tax=Steinernema carpocapsae TaxID=34508 RepID=A0A4U5MG82_STECR|nr:hypothetical protein L596_024261 [Steinernema carpocapsae]